MQRVEYTLKQAKLFTLAWSSLVLLELLLITVSLFAPGPIKWWSIGIQVATLCMGVIYLRYSLAKLARVRAKQERVEWEAAMLAQWVNH